MASTPHGRLQLTIDSSLDQVFLVGWAVKGVLREIGLDEIESYQLELCVVEAVNNSIEHAYGASPGHPVGVELEVGVDRLVFRIADQGTPMPPSALRPPAAGHDGPESLAERGRGMLIIATLMHEVRYESSEGRNVLTLVRRLDSCPAVPGASLI